MNIVQHEGLNFLLTNRIPRRMATSCVGWVSHVEHPVVCAVSLWLWQRFARLDLRDAEETQFRSMHHCFTRRLRPGARPADPDPAVLASPCDGIVGACGAARGGQVLQVKGMPYAVADLLGDEGHAEALRDGVYVTLRLTSAMYHRFHAPHAARVDGVTHFFGDAWNVNQAALKRVPGLFCRNERAVIRMTLAGTGHGVTLVPVAAILVAGIRLNFLAFPPEHRSLPRQHYASAAALAKGEEMGWFEHGSTILVFAPRGFRLADGIREGAAVRAGAALMRLPG